jgi:hypothetical protein
MNYTNTGALFPNQYKKDKQPDMKGDITLERSLLRQLLSETDEDNIKIKLSAWKREGRSGEFLSLAYDAYRKPDEAKPAPKPAPKKPSAFDDMDDDIPF